MTDLVGQQMGSYRLTRLLGQGGFADVYLAEHIFVHSRQTAIKVLSDRYTDAELQRFCNEVSTIFHLVHPHIVRVLDFGVEGRMPFLVMDYAPNGTLRQRHPIGTQVPLESVLGYVQQLANALTYAHAEKVVHRDIKPENLLVGKQDHILLSDFGIAIKSHREVSKTPQWISGTACYMAPEQCRGNAVPESDQYSLAIVVYEWLCGEPPFQAESPFSVVIQHLQMQPPPLRDKVPTLSPAVEQVVLRALAKKTKDRFPGVQAFADALEEAARVSVLLPTSTSGPYPVANTPRPEPVPEPVPITRPLLKERTPARPRRERSMLEKGSFPYSVGGWIMVLIGIVALVQGNGHPSVITWTVGVFAIVIGCIICIAAFLLS
jgi:serine/threonine protein kinase